MIFATQWTFTFGSIAFQSQSLKGLFSSSSNSTAAIDDSSSTAKIEPGDENTLIDLNNIWTYGVIVIVILTLLAWVRNIAVFRFSFFFANMIMVVSMAVTCIYAVCKIIKNKQFGPGVVAINHEHLFATLGYAIYTFEGIGTIMPIMHACECPDKFIPIYIAATSTVTALFIVYGSLSYLGYGNMKEQIVFQILPQGDTLVKWIIFLNVVNMMCTYPLTVYPAN